MNMEREIVKKIYWFEPLFFLFFGIFHLHRIWGIQSADEIASDVLEDKLSLHEKKPNENK